MKNILIADDDRYIVDMLSRALTSRGYSVTAAYSGTEAMLVLEGKRPDLVLLDLMMPGLSGDKVLEKTKNIPVIIVSAVTDVDDKVKLLTGGAADYITKPFEIKELIARINVRLRDKNPAGDRLITWGDISLDRESAAVEAGGKRLKLTRTEYAILKALLLRPDKVITKSALLDRISLDTPDCTENSLKTHISNLRGKLREATGKSCIRPVWGIGYKMELG